MQHFFVEIHFQKSCVALFKMLDQIFAGSADIGENAHVYFTAANYKTMRIACVMHLSKCCDGEVADNNRLVWMKRLYEMALQCKAAGNVGAVCHINGNTVFLNKPTNPFDVVAMLVRYKNRFYFMYV